MKKFLNKETLLYLFFGVLTTAVNYIVFYLFYQLLALSSLLSNAIAFAAAVIFAYIVNKQFVFESKSWKPAVIGPELLQFLGARVFSFLLEEAGLLICDNLLNLGRFRILSVFGIQVDGILLSKLALAFIVVILNYFFCKWFIFKKK